MGLILVVFYLLTGIDDFIWDTVTLVGRFKFRVKKLDLQKLDAVPPKLLAVIIAAWREDNVLGDVIDNVIASVHYPKSMYHIFLGVYPNDAPTIGVASALAERYPNVHIVINCLPGPTSKAQNVNYVITRVKDFETEHGWKFASLTIHDSEDVVHPYELKVTNYMIDYYPALQFPVFPIIRMPRSHNFFRNITTGTYADEFAENHFSTMVSRRNAGAFVPSAGTGFALSRATLDSFGDGDVLPRDSLTEDYRLSLTLYEKGIPMHYVLERVPRILNENKLVWDFIATRSMFPNTFKTAVKQKTRWILGITMQSFKFRDIFSTKGLRLAGRYSLYKDLKAKVGNLLAMAGYPVLIYFIVSLFITLNPIYPVGSLSWHLSLVVTAMMIERQLFRGVAIYHVYGMRSVFFACLFPPLIPLRLVWGNVVNLVATLKAYKQFFFGNKTPKDKEKKAEKKTINPKKAVCMRYACAFYMESCFPAGHRCHKLRHEPVKIIPDSPSPVPTAAAEAAPVPAGGRPKKLAWAKTDHTFLPQNVLKRYQRNLGDVLLEKGIITPDELKDALRDMDSKKQTLGNYLLQNRVITERQLLTALSSIKHIQFIDNMSFERYDLKPFAADFDERLLRRLLALPLLKMEAGYLVAFCDGSPQNAQSIIRTEYDIEVKAVFASRETIVNGLYVMFGAAGKRSILLDLYEKEMINSEQVVIGNNYLASIGRPEAEMLEYMGLLPREETSDAVSVAEKTMLRHKPDSNFASKLKNWAAM